MSPTLAPQPLRIAVLNDYQKVAQSLAPWDDLGAEVVFFHDHQHTQAEVLARLEGFDVVVAMRERTRFTSTLFKGLKNLKLLVSTGGRNPAIDLEAATEQGLPVCFTDGGGTATAEMAWALIFAVTRQIPREDKATREGHWQTSLGVELRGKTLGLLGLGRVGGAVAAAASVFGMHLIAWSENLSEETAHEHRAERVTKEKLFRASDVLSIHTLLSRRTRGMVGSTELAWMKPTAFLVNTARGPIVDEAALVQALENHKIAGAALDVFDEEPLPSEHPFLTLDNLILSPHKAYVTDGVYQTFFTQVVENIAAWQKGKPIRLLNPEVYGQNPQEG